MVRSMLLRGFDRDMVNLIQSEMEDKGVKFIFETLPIKVSKQSNGKLLVEWKGKEVNYFVLFFYYNCFNFVILLQNGQDEFDTVLVATGRKALSEELNPSAAGLQIHPESGKLIVNDEQTNIPNIYAVGDVLYVSTN